MDNKIKDLINKVKILENGSLLYENNTIGSIHRIGALIQQTLSCNGWKFCYISKNNKVLLLSVLRTQYIRNFHNYKI